MERRGECNQCGDCCRLLPNWKDLPDITKALFRMQDTNAEIILSKVKNGKCSFLIEVSNEKTECALFHNSLRPNFCKNFPMEPENLARLPRCSYHFEVRKLP